MAKTFEELKVWRKAHACVLTVYEMTRHFPKHEMYGLTSQIRRACAGVPSAIAEGFRRNSTADKLRFYNYAETSLDEARYHLILARDLEYKHEPELFARFDEVGRMLTAYIAAIKRNPPR